MHYNNSTQLQEWLNIAPQVEIRSTPQINCVVGEYDTYCPNILLARRDHPLGTYESYLDNIPTPMGYHNADRYGDGLMSLDIQKIDASRYSNSTVYTPFKSTFDPSDIPPSCSFNPVTLQNECTDEGFYALDDWLMQQISLMNNEVSLIDQHYRYADYYPSTVLSLNYTNAPVFTRDSDSPQSQWDPPALPEHMYFNYTVHATANPIITNAQPVPIFAMNTVINLFQNIFNLAFYRDRSQEQNLYMFGLFFGYIAELPYYLEFGVPEFGYPFLFICMGFILMMNTETFLSERENKLKGNLELNGLKQWPFFLSWWVSFFVSCFIVCVVTYITMGVTANPVVLNNSIFAFILMFLGWAFLSASYSFFITAFFSTSKIGVLVVVILLLFTPDLYAITPLSPFSTNEDGSPTRVYTKDIFQKWDNMNDNTQMFMVLSCFFLHPICMECLTSLAQTRILLIFYTPSSSSVDPYRLSLPYLPSARMKMDLQPDKIGVLVVVILLLFTPDLYGMLDVTGSNSYFIDILYPVFVLCRSLSTITPLSPFSTNEDGSPTRVYTKDIFQKWDNMNDNTQMFMVSLVEMALFGVFYFVLGMYLNLVLPHESEIPKDPLFFITDFIKKGEREEKQELQRARTDDHEIMNDPRDLSIHEATETVDLGVNSLLKSVQKERNLAQYADIHSHPLVVRNLIKLFKLTKKPKHEIEEEDEDENNSLHQTNSSDISIGQLSDSDSTPKHEHLQSSSSSVSDYLHAVDDVSFVIPNDQVFGLLGANGAGKSTTISMICGQLRPSGGKVWIGGKCVTCGSKERREATTKVGIVFQFDRLWPLLTVYEHIELYCNFNNVYDLALAEETQLIAETHSSRGSKHRSIKNPKKKKILGFMALLPSSCSQDFFMHSYIMHIVKQVGLLHAAHRRVSALSGGMRRRVSIGISLVGSPSLILLDEFSSGLDPHTKHEVWDLLPVLREGRAVLLTTHDMQEAEALCDRISIINRGKLVCLDDSVRLVSMFEHNAVVRITLSKRDPSAIIRCYKTEEEDQKEKGKKGEEVTQEEDSSTKKYDKAVQFPGDVLDDGFLAHDFSPERIQELRKEFYHSFQLNKERVESVLSRHLKTDLEKLTDSGGVVSYTIPLQGKRGELLRGLRSLEKQGVIVEWTIENASLETVFGAVVGELEKKM
ncbi:ABC transporter A like protein [Aduncisulcus paluster]|uniref:ABC transporter A like protein n=1 Tax=Aduncisulcus paluster TaxID=2918883 RepID=A0ABQ5KXT1_9EUKA|nr:ABC transporter A like protein [Aduncisulcus paluster]